jgi:hypothetical protein
MLHMPASVPASGAAGTCRVARRGPDVVLGREGPPPPARRASCVPQEAHRSALVGPPPAVQPVLTMEAAASLHALVALGTLCFPELALSAYLPTARGAPCGFYRALLEDLAGPELHKLTGTERAALRRELPDVVAALQRRRLDCPAVAVFSCRPDGFMRVWRLAEPLPGRVAVADLLDLAPIRLQLFMHPPVLAVVVDEHQARLYALLLDEVTEVGRMEDVWNPGGVADVVADLLRRDGYRRLVLAGPTEARAELKGLLPPSALELLTAEGSIPTHAGGRELVERLRTLEHHHERV